MARLDNKTMLFQPELVSTALQQSFVKLNPQTIVKNPLMFMVEIGTAVMLAVVVYAILSGDRTQGSLGYNISVFVVLYLTLWFANFAEAIAEARGKAQAESLRRTRQNTSAKRINNEQGIMNNGGNNFTPGIDYSLFTVHYSLVSSAKLQLGDRFVCEAGDVIAMNDEIVEGIATIDESNITGESAPVIRESGGDKSSVTGGTKVLSDRIVVKVTTKPGETFLDKMIALAEGANRQKTLNEIALTILLATFTIVFIIVCFTLKPFVDYANTPITIGAFIYLFVFSSPLPLADC